MLFLLLLCFERGASSQRRVPSNTRPGPVRFPLLYQESFPKRRGLNQSFVCSGRPGNGAGSDGCRRETFHTRCSFTPRELVGSPLAIMTRGASCVIWLLAELCHTICYYRYSQVCPKSLSDRSWSGLVVESTSDLLDISSLITLSIVSTGVAVVAYLASVTSLHILLLWRDTIRNLE